MPRCWLRAYILLSRQHTIQQGRQIMHSPHQRDAHPQPVCSRRIFLGSALAASASVVAGALAGCQRPSTLEVVQPTTGGGRDDLSDSVIGKDKIRIGMEAAYAPYNWQVSEASEYTIPIDNVQAPMPTVTTCRSQDRLQGPRRRARCRQAELLGPYRFAQQRPDRPHHRRHERHARARGVRRLFRPVLYRLLWPVRKRGSPYQNATKLSDFSGATVLGQKDTMLDTVIDEIPGVSTKTRSTRSPRCFRICCRARATRDLQH